MTVHAEGQDSHAAKAPTRGDRRAAIFEAALALFLEKGFQATSMDMIATRAKASKETLYRHFGNKERLLAASVEEIGCRVAASAEETSHDCPQRALTAFGHELARVMAEPRAIGIFRLLAAEANRSPHLARLFDDAGPRRGRVAFGAMLAAFAARGELAIDDPADAAGLFVALVFGDVFRDVMIGLRPPLNDAERAVQVERAVTRFLRLHGND